MNDTIRFMRSVDRKLQKKRMEDQRRLDQKAGSIVRGYITDATPWDVRLRGPRRSVRHFLKLVFITWLLGILVALLFMVADGYSHRDVPAAPATLEIPL